MLKAYLMVRDEDKASKVKSLEFLFNPKEFSVSRQNTWSQGKAAKGVGAGKNVPTLEFGGGQPASMTLELLFDTYHHQENGKPESVYQKYIEKLSKFVDVNEHLKEGTGKHQKKRPPRVVFVWGEFVFDGAITSMKVQYTMFTNDGRPVRASVSLSLQQVDDKKSHPPQNPTSGGLGGERHWHVKRGDTLQWIAHEELGDATQWRQIADKNGLDRVRRLEPGRVLMIPTDLN
jgi:nucleoid-associated protein YgaU